MDSEAIHLTGDYLGTTLSGAGTQEVLLYFTSGKKQVSPF